MFSKIIQTTVITLAVLILTIVMGCSLVMDAITPCYVPAELGTFVGEDMTSFVPYTTVFDAERMLRKMYYLAEGVNMGITGAREFQAKVFNPAGPLGLLMVGGPALALGALGISKPKDKKKLVELEKKGN